MGIGDVGGAGASGSAGSPARRPSGRRRAASAATRGRSVEPKETCMKAFTIFTIFVAAITLLAGALGILASQNLLASGVGVVSQLSQIGVVNSYLMVGGGFALFALGIGTLMCRRQSAAE